VVIVRIDQHMPRFVRPVTLDAINRREDRINRFAETDNEYQFLQRKLLSYFLVIFTRRNRLPTVRFLAVNSDHPPNFAARRIAMRNQIPKTNFRLRQSEHLRQMFLKDEPKSLLFLQLANLGSDLPPQFFVSDLTDQILDLEITIGTRLVAGRRYSSGNVSLTVVPRPNLLSMVAEPPWRSTIDFTKARPRPAPSEPRDDSAR
jgi:hypothetical protein